MSEAIARRALGLWDLGDGDLKLVAQRENMVFRVSGPGNGYALRLHRPGYRSEAELNSELDWLAHLHKCGLHVPLPVAARDGNCLHWLDGYPVSVLTWLSGKPMGETGGTLDVADRPGAFDAIGEAMARLHEASDAWQVPEAFQRCRWDYDGLLSEKPLWGRFWDNPQLSPRQRELIKTARDRAREQLRLVERTEDFGLIHADLVRENVLFSEGAPQLIDFDDGGYGFRLFDVATTLNKNREEADYSELEAAFFEGYRRVRPVDLDHLSLFTLLRSFTYLGWIISRMDEPGASGRCARFIDNAVTLSQDFLAAETAG